MPNHSRLFVEAADDRFEMVGHLPDRLAGEYFRTLVRLLNRLRVIRPAWSQRGIPIFLE
jgi:hypothetical protein